MTDITPITLLSIDPGTNITGWAIWHDEELVQWGQIKARSKDRWERIGRILAGLREATFAGDGVYILPRSIAIEVPFVRSDLQRSTLDYLVGAIYGQFVADGSGETTWHPYHQSTVKAATVPRGLSLSKVNARTSIEALFPQIGRSASDDEVDAIAVGWCHLQHQPAKLEVLE